MITAPVLLLIFDRVFLSPSWKAVLQRRWLFYLGFAPAMFWLTANSVGRVENHAGFGCIVVSPLEYVRSQPGVILHYLRLAAFPDRLCFDYGWPVATTWQEILVPTAIVARHGVASVALRYRPRWASSASPSF